MVAALDFFAWYLTAVLVGYALIPAIYGFHSAVWAIAPMVGIVFIAYRSIVILKSSPPGTLARWTLIAVIIIVLRSSFSG